MAGFRLLPILVLVPFLLATKPSDLISVSMDQSRSLMELYTSEGCSSCPPADKYLSRIKVAKQPVSPVAFHVDYWNYLGWTDIFSHATFTARQHWYAKTQQLQQVFTPSIRVNGQLWKAWRKNETIPKPVGNGKLRVSMQKPPRLDVEFFESGFKESLVLHAVVTDSGVRRKIKGGENKGELLIHDYVALSLQQAPITYKTDSHKGSVLLAKTIPVGKSKRLVLWVTREPKLGEKSLTPLFVGELAIPSSLQKHLDRKQKKGKK